MQEKTEKQGLQQISTAGYHSKLDLFQGALLGLFVLQKSEGAEGQTAVGLQQREKVRQTICKSQWNKWRVKQKLSQKWSKLKSVTKNKNSFFFPIMMCY